MPPERSAPSAASAAAPAPGNIEIWNDLVSPRALVVALVVSVAAIAAACAVATLLGEPLLFWGLGGAAIGFAVNCLLIRPKRDVRVVDDAEAGIDADPAAADATGGGR